MARKVAALTVFALAVLLVASVPAQLPSTTKYVISNFSSTGNGIRGYDASGTVTTFVTLTGFGGSTDSISMAPTNDALLVWDTNGVHRYDLTTGTQTFTTLAFSSGGVLNWGALDENGGMIWIENAGALDGLMRGVDTKGSVATLIWKDTTTSGILNACCWNGSTGGYCIAKFSGTNAVTFIARDGTVTRTVTSISVMSGLDWNPWTGDIMVSRFGGSSTPGILRISQTGTVTSLGTGNAATSTANGVEVLDQNGLNAEQFLVCDFGGAPTYLSLMDGLGTITTLNSGSYGPSDCEELFARKLWGMNSWVVGSTGQMNLNMGKASANNFYQVALSFGHLGFNLGTFRLHLAPDGLFFLTALNLAPSIFKNFFGKLDVNGLPSTVQPSVAIPAIPQLKGFRVFGGAISYNTQGVITGVTNCWGITLR